MPQLNNLIDEPKDILALFGGIVITITLIVAVFFSPFGEIALGALIGIVVLIYNHFFQKQSSDDGSN